MHATERTSSLEGDETNAVAGGIGAALSHYDGIKRIVSSRRLASPASVGFGLNKFAPAVALGRGHGSSNDVALSPSLAAKTSVLAGTEPPEHLLLPPGVYSNLASSEDVRAPAYSTYGSAGYFVGSLTNSGSPAHAPSPSTQLVRMKVCMLRANYHLILKISASLFFAIYNFLSTGGQTAWRQQCIFSSFHPTSYSRTSNNYVFIR